MNDLLKQLAAPFPATQIHWRAGPRTQDKSRGIALAFLNARDVMERLDSVVGPENWQCRYPFPGCCELSIRIDGEWITKSNCAGETDIEGEKGMASAAMKRAAVLWSVGRYLYDLPNKFWPLENGRFSAETQRELTERLAAWQEKYFERRAA